MGDFSLVAAIVWLVMSFSEKHSESIRKFIDKVQLYFVLFAIWSIFACIPMYIGIWIGKQFSDQMSGYLGFAGLLLAIILTVCFFVIRKSLEKKPKKIVKPLSLKEFKDVVVNKEYEDNFIKYLNNTPHIDGIRFFVETVVSEINKHPVRYVDEKSFNTTYDKDAYDIDANFICLTKDEVISYYGDRLDNEDEINEVLNCCRKIVVIMLLAKRGFVPSWFFDDNKGFAKSDYSLMLKEWSSVANNLFAWINVQLILNDRFTYTDTSGKLKTRLQPKGVIIEGKKTRYINLPSSESEIDSYTWEPMIKNNLCIKKEV